MGSKRTRYFQWVDGELKGSITTLKNITEFDGEYFYNLDDGEVCNLRLVAPMTNNPDDIKNKFLVEILSPAYAWKVEVISTHTQKVFDPERGEVSVEVPPLEDIIKAGGQQEVELTDSALGKKKIIPPLSCPRLEPLPALDDYLVVDNIDENNTETSIIEANVNNSISNQKQQETSLNATKTANTAILSDPVGILVENCKKHTTSVTMTVNIDLPKKSVYTMAEEEFENGGEKFIEYLSEKIDIESIKQALKQALIDAYSKKKEQS